MFDYSFSEKYVGYIYILNDLYFIYFLTSCSQFDTIKSPNMDTHYPKSEHVDIEGVIL